MCGSVPTTGHGGGSWVFYDAEGSERGGGTRFVIELLSSCEGHPVLVPAACPSPGRKELRDKLGAREAPGPQALAAGAPLGWGTQQVRPTRDAFCCVDRSVNGSHSFLLVLARSSRARNPFPAIGTQAGPACLGREQRVKLTLCGAETGCDWTAFSLCAVRNGL